MKTKNSFFVIAILFCIFLQKSFAQESRLVLIDGKLKAVSENQVKEKSDTVDLNLTVSDCIYIKYSVDSFVKNPNLKELKVGFIQKEKGKWISLTKLNVREIYEGKLIRQDGKIKFIDKEIDLEQPETNYFYIFNFLAFISYIIVLLLRKKNFFLFIVALAAFAFTTFALGSASNSFADLAIVFAALAFVSVVLAGLALIFDISDVFIFEGREIKIILLSISLVFNILAGILMYC